MLVVLVTNLAKNIIHLFVPCKLIGYVISFMYRKSSVEDQKQIRISNT